MIIHVTINLDNVTYNHFNGGKGYNLYLTANDKTIHRIAMEQFIKNIYIECEVSRRVSSINTDDINLFDNLKGYLFGPKKGQFAEFTIVKEPAPSKLPFHIILCIRRVNNDWDLKMTLIEDDLGV